MHQVEALEPRALLSAAPHVWQDDDTRSVRPVRTATFTNPIGMGGDPWVVRHGGMYYYAHGEDAIGSTSIYVHKSPTLQDVVSAPAVRVWQAPPGTAYSTQVWAPELHHLDGKWYIYFTASSGNWVDHRMYVLEAAGSDAQGAYTFRGKIAAATDNHAIDGSILHHGGQRYFIWSGWDTPTSSDEQRVYIGRMSSPLTIDGDRIEISRPTYPWELVGGSRVNEGPTALHKNGTVHVTFSVNNYWMSEYSLARVTLALGGNPMDAAAWVKHPEPIFAQANGVRGVGHASFTKSPDQTQDWIVYHSMEPSGLRSVRIQPFTWNPDDSPNFGQPVPTGAPLAAPSNNPAIFIDGGASSAASYAAGTINADDVALEDLAFTD